MDIIYLNDLQLETVIGIYDWERQLKQTLIVDLEMAADIQRTQGSAPDHRRRPSELEVRRPRPRGW